MKSAGAPGPDWEPTKAGAKARWADEHPFKSHTRFPAAFRKTAERAAEVGISGALAAGHAAVMSAGGYGAVAGAAAIPAVAVVVAGLAGYVLGSAILEDRKSVV